MTAQDYTYALMWDAEDREYVATVREYVATVREFPSLSCLHQKPMRALLGLEQIVADTLADMQKNGEKPPRPAR